MQVLLTGQYCSFIKISRIWSLKNQTRHKGSPPAGKKRSKQSGSTMMMSIFPGFGDAVSVNAVVGRDIGHSDLISENGYWVSFGVGYLSPGMRS
jgi:hypothetical protein